MNINNEMYENICKAEIQNSILIVTKILLRDTEKGIETIQFTFISLCSYIATFISVYDIKLWINVIENITTFIEEEQFTIKDIYIIITKLCILCDIYNKNPVVKTGSLNLKILRTKILDIFQNDNIKLSSNGISKFEGILPPIDSETYNLGIQIITGIVSLIKELDKIDDFNKVHDIANKLRLSFDYIIRKKYTFETKFYESDNDSVWFIWGLISLLYNDYEVDLLYKLFTHDYNKKSKNNKIGLLYGASIVMIYLKKKNIARMWNNKELDVIKKIDELSIELFNDIKKNLIKSNEIISNKPQKSSNSGVDYLCTFIPEQKHQEKTIIKEKINDEDTTKCIKYKNN